MSLTKPTSVSLMIAVWDWGAYLGEKLLRLTVSSFCRPHPKSIHIEAKICGHYVNSILATTEAKKKVLMKPYFWIAMVFSRRSGSEFIFEKDGKLFTPQLGNILPGITRSTVLELADELDLEVEQGKFTKEDLFQADSAFYCGTAAEVVGIASVDDYQFPTNWNDSLGKNFKMPIHFWSEIH